MENIKFYITNTLLLIIAIGIITYVATSVFKHFEKSKKQFVIMPDMALDIDPEKRKDTDKKYDVKFKTDQEGWINYEDKEFERIRIKATGICPSEIKPEKDSISKLASDLPAYSMSLDERGNPYPVPNCQKYIGNVTPAEPPKNY